MTNSATESAIRALSDSLQTVAAQLKPSVSVPHRYRTVSFRNAAEMRGEIGNWLKSGKSTAPPTLTPENVRSEIFGFGRCSSDIKAYRAVFSLISLDYVETCLTAFRRNQLSIALASLRSLIERIAHAKSTENSATKLLLMPANNHRERFDNIAAIGEVFAVALHGTKLDWSKIAKAGVARIRPKDATYSQVENAQNLKARQILNSIDELDSTHAGLRLAYELLCEFLHPNVGDFYSSITRADLSIDPWSLRHLETSIGEGSRNFENAVDLDAVLAEAIGISMGPIDAIPILERQFLKMANTITWRTQRILRPAIKQNRDLFLAADNCPCGSDQQLSNCCGSRF